MKKSESYIFDYSNRTILSPVRSDGRNERHVISFEK